MPAVVFAVLAALAAAGASAAPSPRATLVGSAPSWATSSNFKSAAAATARAASTPGGAGYRQYLTPAQFRQQFARSQSDVGVVKSWLQGQGFTTVYTPANNLYVSAEGTVAQAAAAFGVQFGEYTVE